MSMRAYKGLSVRDLRLSRLNKRIKLQPCQKEIMEYFDAVAQLEGAEDKVAWQITSALQDCENKIVSFSCFHQE